MTRVPQRRLGSQGLVCSQQGLGVMGMSMLNGVDPDKAEEEHQKVIAKALEIGINFFDTAWIYSFMGIGNEAKLGRAIKIHGRDKFIIATKFGVNHGPSGMTVDGSEATIRSQLADSLSRLDTDYIDLYYQHRMDPNVPIEDTMRVLKSLVEAGTIRYIGLSECTAAELRRAHAIHPITAIQMEWSLYTRTLEAEVVPTARELGVGIVAYSPLGRGFLTSKMTSLDQLDPADLRRRSPRFSADNFAANVPKASFNALAEEKGCTPAQLALAWVHNQGEDVFPIPGTKSVARLLENAGATGIVLTAEDKARVEAAAPEAQGERYVASSLAHTFEARQGKL